jgi:hypothetical protein
VTHVLLQEGHLWGRKKVSITVSAENGIWLSLTKSRQKTCRQPTDPGSDLYAESSDADAVIGYVVAHG